MMRLVLQAVSATSVAAALVADLAEPIAELAAMQRTLQKQVDCCHGDHRPDCPILEVLGQDGQ